MCLIAHFSFMEFPHLVRSTRNGEFKMNLRKIKMKLKESEKVLLAKEMCYSINKTELKQNHRYLINSINEHKILKERMSGVMNIFLILPNIAVYHYKWYVMDFWVITFLIFF